jgi:gamma-carbonic anhydrase
MHLHFYLNILSTIFCAVSRHKEVRGIFEKIPSVAKGVFVAPTAAVVGSVKIGANSNVWYGAVVKGDAAKVTIGENTNIKDGALIGSSKKGGEITIGNNVSVGSGAFIGAATVEDNVSIGAGANVADGVHIQKGGAVADGALVAANTTIPSGQVHYPGDICLLLI